MRGRSVELAGREIQEDDYRCRKRRRRRTEGGPKESHRGKRREF